MNYKVSDIEGIGAVQGRKLAKAGVKTVNALLSKGATRKGRKEISTVAGIRGATILKWVNMADLYRIKGVGKQYAELLEKAGVDTVKELKQRRPEALVKTLAEVNSAGKKRLVRVLPGIKRVRGWIKEAKKSTYTISY